MNKKWDIYETKIWELGNKEPFIRMSDKSMAQVTKAVITCEAQIIDTYCGEKRSGLPEFLYSNRNCCVVFLIKLPIGAEEDFERLSGFKLSEPIKVHLNQG